MLIPAEEEQTETKFIVRISEEDPFYIEIDQAKRRIVVQLAASPIRTNFLRRWILIMTEIAKLNIERDAPIDLVYDYTQAKQVEPSLKVIMFTKALGSGKLFPSSSNPMPYNGRWLVKSFLDWKPKGLRSWL